MTKHEFIDVVAEKTGMTKKDAERATGAVLDAIAEVMASGDKIQFPGFGTFKTRKRAAFIGRNPQTGDPLAIAEAVVPVFEASRGLKERVNG